MTVKKQSLMMGGLAAAIAFGLMGAAADQVRAEYPEKRIEMLIGFAAGGGTDLVSRRIAEGMERELGQTVTPVNKPGAGGLIALQEAAAAEPDGYTLSSFVANNALIQKHFEEIVNFVDPLEELTILGMVNADYWAIAVPSDAPYDTIPEFIEYLEENPGAKVSDGGPGSAYHWGWRTFEDITGVSIETVTYGGTAAALSALAGRELTASSTAVPEAASLVDAGLIKVLGVAAPERYESFPDVATFSEQGVEMVYGPTRGIAGPAGLSDEVVETLSDAIRVAFESEAYQTFLSDSGYSGFYLDHEEATEFLASEEERLMGLMERAGVLRQP